MKSLLTSGCVLVAMLAASCSSSTDPGKADQAAGTVTHFSECKRPSLAASADSVGRDQSCLQYTYDGDSVLTLKHVNAGFNCCPDSLTATFGFMGSAITITEAGWVGHPCDCLCLFDMDFRITGVPPGRYTIRMTEVDLSEGAEVLQMTVNLTSAGSGQHCVTRNQYPWGQL